MSAPVTSAVGQPAPPAKATALHARPSATYSDKLQATTSLLRQAAAAGADTVTQASSLGAEDVVISHLIHSLDLNIPVFVLETGALHTETLALLERTQAMSTNPVQVVRPQTEAVLNFVRTHGQAAMYESAALRKACCGVRKMEPLARALAGKTAWITGLRREQSGARGEVPGVDHSEVASKGLTKFNPLAAWTWGDVWHYIATHGVDYNPLHDQFYPSIGCAPCTRAISLGEDFRSGRWWWESSELKECGLHAAPAAPAPAVPAASSTPPASGAPGAVRSTLPQQKALV